MKLLCCMLCCFHFQPCLSDDESVVSSQASDLESPRPSSSTPRCRLLSSDQFNNCDSDLETPCKSSPILVFLYFKF